MKEEIKSILGKHKVIGDTTYGLGYAEAEQLTNEIIASFVNVLEKMEAPADSEYDLEAIHEGYFVALEDVKHKING